VKIPAKKIPALQPPAVKKPAPKTPVAKAPPAPQAPAPKTPVVKTPVAKAVPLPQAPAVAKPVEAAPVPVVAIKTQAPAPAPAPSGPSLVIRPFSRVAEAKKNAADKQPAKPQKLSPTELRKIRDDLVAMRNRLTVKTNVMRRVALERNDEINTEEDGIDQFDRLFEIEKIASVQEFIYLIDEALHALDEGVYGNCQKCGCHIEKARIQALPFAKTCVHCQNEAERAKAR